MKDSFHTTKPVEFSLIHSDTICFNNECHLKTLSSELTNKLFLLSKLESNDVYSVRRDFLHLGVLKYIMMACSNQSSGTVSSKEATKTDKQAGR